jgi:hypothetical protein
METKTTPKDFFLNLGAIITLYFSIISFLNLVFSLINKFFPDALAYNYGITSTTNLHWAISSLIINVPLYIYLTKLINKDIVINPDKKNIWIKKWSSYLTLFLTGATITVDLIILINTFLGGEVTTRFILKVIAVLAVAAFIFSHYLFDLKSNPTEGAMRIRNTTYIASAVILLVIIGGFFAAGSPFAERQRKFDDRRIEDLSSIQYQMINYWQKKGTIPASLADLNDPLSNFTVPVDPETGKPYEYIAGGTYIFSLCAIFDLPSRDINSPKTIPVYPAGNLESFTHPAGRTCFDRTIDPALYPPVKQ